MAFDVQGLNLSTYSANDRAPRIHTYDSMVDSLDAITGSPEYFGPIANVLQVRDLFYISALYDGSPANSGYFIVTDTYIDGKEVVLAALTSRSSFAYYTIDAGEEQKIYPNSGYIFTGIPNGDENIIQTTVTLPVLKQLRGGDVISFINATGVTVKINQNPGQQTIWGISKTLRDADGYMKFYTAGDKFTLLCAGIYSDPPRSDLLTFIAIDITGRPYFRDV